MASISVRTGATRPDLGARTESTDTLTPRRPRRPPSKRSSVALALAGRLAEARSCHPADRLLFFQHSLSTSRRGLEVSCLRFVTQCFFASAERQVSHSVTLVVTLTGWRSNRISPRFSRRLRPSETVHGFHACLLQSRTEKRWQTATTFGHLRMQLPSRQAPPWLPRGTPRLGELHA